MTMQRKSVLENVIAEKNNIIIVSEQKCPIKNKLLLSQKHLGSRFKSYGPIHNENLYLIKSYY